LRYILTERDKRMLREVASIADELDRMREGLREMELRTVPGQRLDGLPRGSGSGDTVANAFSAIEELRRRIQLKEDELDRARRSAERITKKLKASMRMYCQARYIEGRSVEAACAYARISLRTGERYSAVINRE